MARVHHSMLGLAVAVVVGLLPVTGRADLAIVTGNNPQTDENVLLNKGTTGNTVFGTTNQTAQSVSFNSLVQVLSEPANGQARIEAASGNNLLGLNSISVPGGTFTSLIFNEFFGSGTTTITLSGLTASNQPESLTQSFSLGNGSNFFTMTAVNGERLTSVGFTSPGGFTDLRQVRIGGAALNPIIPEPATIILMGVGVAAVAGYSWRRRPGRPCRC